MPLTTAKRFELWRTVQTSSVFISLRRQEKVSHQLKAILASLNALSEKIPLQEQGQVLSVTSSKHKMVERKSESQEGIE